MVANEKEELGCVEVLFRALLLFVIAPGLGYLIVLHLERTDKRLKALEQAAQIEPEPFRIKWLDEPK